MTEYYECIKSTSDNFTIGRIYKIKIRNPLNLEDYHNFIDDRGKYNGFSDNNYKYFTPSTEEKWFKQEGIEYDYLYLIEFFNQNNIK